MIHRGLFRSLLSVGTNDEGCNWEMTTSSKLTDWCGMTSGIDLSRWSVVYTTFGWRSQGKRYFDTGNGN
jgi:hypothetical protein